MKRPILTSLLAGIILSLPTHLILAGDAPLETKPGANLPRTMKLITTSTRQKRNTVRVLFYGQSITAQWSGAMEKWLRKTYPSVNFVFGHKAIGGFGAARLVKTTPTDVLPFYPDLVIFHDYTEDPVPYEEMIRTMLAGTTTEILIANDHVTKPEQMTEETDPAKVKQEDYIPWHNYYFLPDLSRRYGLEFVNVRDEWKSHLKSQSLEPDKLLKDVVHLNEPGVEVMREIISKHFQYVPGKEASPEKVTEFEVGKDVQWVDNKLELEFQGNRVDIIAKEGPRAESATDVLIDGKKPSELSGTIVFNRTSQYPDTWWPAVMRIGSETALVPEDWTLRIFEASDDMKDFKFEVTGSVTGPDGTGTSTEKFVSNSKRVIIDPDDWHIARARDMTKKPMPEGFTVTWKAVPQSMDQYNAPRVMTNVVETATTVAQGFPSGTHRLTLIAPPNTTPPAIQSIRVYRPEVPQGAPTQTAAQ